MGTKIIDALLVTLGLDDSNYREGQERATKELKQTRKAITEASDAMAKAVRNVSAQFALAFLGFSSATGLVKLLANLNTAAMQMRLLGLNTGNAARQLKEYANAVEVAGGTSEGFIATVQKIQQEQTNFRLRGESAWLPYMRSLQLPSGSQWAMRSELDLLQEFSEAFDRISNTPGQGRPLANSIGLEMGIDQGTMNLLLRGPAAIKDLISKQESLTKGYDKTSIAAEKLRMRWIYLKQQAESLALVLLSQLQGPLTQLADWLTTISTKGITSGEWADGIVHGVDSITAAGKPLLELFSKIEAIVDRLKAAGNWVTTKTNQVLDSRFGKEMVYRWVNSDDKGNPTTGIELTKREAQRGKYLPMLAQAEQRYGLPAGTLQTLAENSSHWNEASINARTPLKSNWLSRLPGNPLNSAGAGLLGLPSSKGPVADIESGARQIAELMTSAIRAINVGKGIGTVYDTGFTDLGYAALSGANPLQASQNIGKQGYGTVLRPDAGSAVANSLQIDQLIIQTMATDAAGIAAQAEQAIRRRLSNAQADYGMR